MNNSELADLIPAAIDRPSTPTSVGLNPVVEKLPAAVRDRGGSPAAMIKRVSSGVIDAVASKRPF